MADETKHPSHAADSTTVFLPLRGRVIGLLVGATILGLCGFGFGGLGGLIAWARLTASTVNPTSDAFVVAAILMALGGFFGLMGTWLLLLAIKCRGMYMEAEAEGVHLTTSLYEWFLWNPWGVRKTWLRWDEIKGLRRWQIPNKLAPGRVQENYVLYTAQGTFVLTNVVWPHPERMVAVIAQRTGLPTARSVSELPPELVPAALPSRREKRGVMLLRGLGWVAIIMGWLVVGLVLLVVVTGQKWQGSLGTTVIFSLVLVLAGHRLRRFRLE